MSGGFRFAERTTLPVRVLFASSVLNLAELIAMRSDLCILKKIVYFHENQLIYPVKSSNERDFQFGYNQIITCLVSDVVIFNSRYNCESFLLSVDTFLRKMPDNKPKGIAEEIRPKCRVLYFPIDHRLLQYAPRVNNGSIISDNTGSPPIHIVWPHRWEFDKDPDSFFDVLFRLANDNVLFTVSVLGESFDEVPPIFEKARIQLSDRLAYWGYCADKKSYIDILHSADIVVSTAKHEFFGVSMMEAVFLGCYPLCPNGLVYPELFPAECLYNTSNQLRKRLKFMCNRYRQGEIKKVQMDLSKFSWNTLKKHYMDLLELEE